MTVEEKIDELIDLCGNIKDAKHLGLKSILHVVKGAYVSDSIIQLAGHNIEFAKLALKEIDQSEKN